MSSYDEKTQILVVASEVGPKTLFAVRIADYVSAD